jgi:hypothetical protein
MTSINPGSFVVARVWNAYGPQDYLSAWDAQWGTVCGGLPNARRFGSRDRAEDAAKLTARLVPTLCGGSPIAWTVLEVAA